MAARCVPFSAHWLALACLVSLARAAGLAVRGGKQALNASPLRGGESQFLHADQLDDSELKLPRELVPLPWDTGIAHDVELKDHAPKLFSLTAEQESLARSPSVDSSSDRFFDHHFQSEVFLVAHHHPCSIAVSLLFVVFALAGSCHYRFHPRWKKMSPPPADDASHVVAESMESGKKERKGLAAWHAVFKLLYLWLTDPDCKWRARLLVFLVMVHWILREAAWALVLSRVDADVINAITSLHETKDVALVKRCLLVALAWKICLAMPLFNLLDPWVSTWFELSFQKHCTAKLLTAYFDGGGQAFYRIKMKETQNGIDNPDQRIGQDIEEISRQIYQLYAAVLSAVFGCTMWAVVIIGLGGPILLVVAAAMSVLRLAIAYGYFGDDLVVAYQGVLLTAADFRYGLTRVRENAEGVALSNGQVREKERSAGVFKKHVDAVVQNTWVTMLYNTVMGFLGHFPSLILWLVQLSSILKGVLRVGDAVRVHQGYDQVTKVLDFLTHNFGTIMVLQANAERLTQLWMACDEENSNFKANEQADGKELANEQGAPLAQIAFQEARPGEAFALADVVVSAPGSPVAVGGVSLECEVGTGLLVSGRSGLGKSSVLRALAGLWLDGGGCVRRAADAEVIYLPQSCYVPIGSLLDIVIYPDAAPAEGSEEFQHLQNAAAAALRRALLGPLLERWGLEGEARDWAVVLSSGEKQRLGFARLFLRLELRTLRNILRRAGVESGSTPSGGVIAVLDESTSAVEVAAEAELYGSLREDLAAKRLLALASVGHRPTLPQFHERELRIGAGARPDEDSGDEQILGTGTWHTPDGGRLHWGHYLLSATR